MKDAILTALKTKFKGSNAVILNRIADKLAKSVTTEEAVATAVEGVTQDLIDVMESYGDSRANEAQQTAVSNYEAKHGLKDGKPNGGGTGQEPKPSNQQPQEGGADDVPAWAKALVEQNKVLAERIAQMNSERTTENRQQQLSAVYEKLPEALRKPYERIAVDAMSDDEFAALVGEITTEVDGLASTLNAKGGVFGRPTNTHGAPTNGMPTEEQLKAVGARGNVVKDGEQPF